MIEEKEEEKVEVLETVGLVDGESMKTIRILMTLSEEMKRRLVQFLKGNLDVFAWSHEDIPSIATEVIQDRKSVV